MGRFVLTYYPNSVEIFGYSSRNQEDKDSYVKILRTRMDAKHNKLSQEFLDSIGLTNEEVKDGLKLPINAYTGTLRAKFSPMFDNLQGFSICTTCQLLLLQLCYDLQKVPTVEIVSVNTDACKFYVDEDYKKETDEVIHNWEKTTGFEMEEDHIVKDVMANVNNYAQICQVDDNDYEVHYKGGFFRGKHIFKWDKKEKKFNYTFEDDLESNSLTICSEALLKNLLFDIPPEEVIYNCNDIFRFQKISHVGNTYEKCVQESPNGDILLQNNNRIYAGKNPSGAIIKIKENGRRDSLADQPPNPIIDNDNHCVIEDIDKEWYVEIAKDWIDRFRGIKRLEEYKKEELLEKAKEYGLDIDKKTKKADLIEIIKKYRKEEKKMATKKEQEIEVIEITNDMALDKRLYAKINEFRKGVRATGFVFDKELPNNLGGGEYYSIDQFYNAIQDICVNVGLDFSFETVELLQFDKELTKPSGKLPIHVATVKTIAKFTDIETGREKNYITIAQGSDTIDKAIASASSMAFRNWFYKNFTPKNMNEEELEKQEVEKSQAPKIPVYVPEQRKEEIKKEVVKQEQHEESDEEDVKAICENIMKIREKTEDDTYGAKTLEKLMSGECSSTDLLEIDLKIKNKMEKVGL